MHLLCIHVKEGNIHHTTFSYRSVFVPHRLTTQDVPVVVLNLALFTQSGNTFLTFIKQLDFQLDHRLADRLECVLPRTPKNDAQLIGIDFLDSKLSYKPSYETFFKGIREYM